MEHFADRLLECCRRRGGPVCVGIDPVYERLPREVRDPAVAGRDDDVGVVIEAMCRYVMGVLDAVADHVPCVKLQSACFERYFWPGVEAYHRLIEEARDFGLIVIGDAKRGDIGISAEHYAAGCLADPAHSGLGPISGPDALTLNTYFGVDGVRPFLGVAQREGKGLFALVRTSNAGGDAVQSLKVEDGRTVSAAVAELVAEMGEESGLVGESGYSLLGAVVGATRPEEAVRLRKLMPRQLFLVPGFGAQGGTADDVRACFNGDGQGALITASRSVIYAYENSPGKDWKAAVRDAAVEMREQVSAVVGR